MTLTWNSPSLRPSDGQHIAYRFEPFEGYHCGTYDAETDSVFGKSGFTSWTPEITQWFGLPEKGVWDER